MNLSSAPVPSRLRSGQGIGCKSRTVPPLYAWRRRTWRKPVIGCKPEKAVRRLRMRKSGYLLDRHFPRLQVRPFHGKIAQKYGCADGLHHRRSFFLPFDHLKGVTQHEKTDFPASLPPAAGFLCHGHRLRRGRPDRDRNRLGRKRGDHSAHRRRRLRRRREGIHLRGVPPVPLYHRHRPHRRRDRGRRSDGAEHHRR